MCRTRLAGKVLMVVALVLSTPTSQVSAEDYVPASSGKRFTPLNGPELRVITGATLGVPIFLDVDSAVVRPGVDMNAWVGLDVEWLVFAAGFGLGWTPIDLEQAPDGAGLGRSPATRIYLTTEVRLQVPKAKSVLPYLSGAFDANWWRHQDVNVSTSCNVWYCTTRARFEFAPGFTGKVGMGIKTGERVYLDVGMKFSLSGAGNFFDSTQWWLTPFVGVIYRGDAG